jgi:hypothetical protein
MNLLRHGLAIFVTGGLACAALPAARAGQVATLTAGYDDLFDNTSFTITNTSGFLEQDVTVSTDLIGGVDSTNPAALGNLAAGSSVNFMFSDGSGGFELDPGPDGVPDTTGYQFSVTLDGAVFTSAPFSPDANLTGGYVNFLGNPATDYTAPFSAIVAAVPEPASVLPLLSALVGLVGLRRRAA